MVITTNLEHGELAEQIGQRTVSRLIEMCGDLKLPLHGGDRRLEADVPEVAPAPRLGSGFVYGQSPS